VATGVISQAARDDIDLSPYLASSSLVGVRLWTRRDRSVIERWPRVNLPAHWQDAGDVVGPRISFAIDELPRPQLVGRITLRGMSESSDSARIGIYLHPEYCGLGLGSSSLLAVQRHLFRSGMKRLLLDVAQDNTRAVRAYLRAGWEVLTTFQRAGFPFYEMQVRP
jgi:RimJ/RimL family protein N-acetyltransferase